MTTLLIIVVLAPLFLSAVFVVLTMLLAMWVFPGGGSRGPHDTLASRAVGFILVLVAEWLSTVWVAIALPFRTMRFGPSLHKLPPNRVPVVVIPGYLENAATMFFLARRLERALGVPVRALVPTSYFTSLDLLALGHRRQITAWMKEIGASRVDLVGHSMGGLLARHLVETGELKGRVRTVITIGTPHLGSAVAVLGLGRAVRQMRRGSAYLEKLNAIPAPEGVHIVGISTTHDNLVVPWNCGLSPRGDNFIIRYRGHLTLILSKEVVRLVVRELSGQVGP